MSNSRAKHDDALLLDIVAAPVRLPSKAEMHVISVSLIDTKHQERSLEPTVDICGPRLAPLLHFAPVFRRVASPLANLSFPWPFRWLACS